MMNKIDMMNFLNFDAFYILLHNQGVAVYSPIFLCKITGRMTSRSDIPANGSGSPTFSWSSKGITEQSGHDFWCVIRIAVN